MSTFVRISASWSSVGMYWSNMIFRYTQSLIWWYRISICLDLSWNIGLIEILMQLWLSQCITIGSKWEPNKSTRIFLIEIASHAAWLVAMYSASAEMSATDFVSFCTNKLLKIRYWKPLLMCSFCPLGNLPNQHPWSHETSTHPSLCTISHTHMCP